MFSTSVTSMLERVRSEFGIQADVLDVNLQSAPGPDRHRARSVRATPELQAAATAALREGRSSEVHLDGRVYRLLPLRRNRSAAALLVVETSTLGPTAASSVRVLDAFVDLLRTAIEADLASVDDVHAERHQSRTLRGILRFLRYVLLAGTEGEVAEAVIHACAVWFDVDARMYRRGPAGDYALAAALPGAEIQPGSERLDDLGLGDDTAAVRHASATELKALGAIRDGLLVPAWGMQSADWVLVLLGSVPADAELTLSVVGRVIGAQMERLALRRHADLRARFELIVTDGARPTELTALEVMRQLVWSTNGSGAALWLQSAAGLRRIASVGAGLHDPGQALACEHLASGTRQVRSLSFGNAGAARLEVVARPDEPFVQDSWAAVDACASVLSVWLAGTGVLGQDDTFDAEHLSGFVRRIEEELARARRFDRRLALLLVQADGDGSGGEHLQEVVEVLRRELRDSDLLGVLGRDRIVALLVETDSTGVGSVVRRVRARLGEEMTQKGLPNVAVGEAAFSSECPTVDALLTRAAGNARQVVSDAV